VHGAEWGGEERAEVEGADDLSYKLDGMNMDCPDVGDTGLDYYGPLFFCPRADGKDIRDFSVELTMSQNVVDTAKINGGVLYYFCRIHSEMNGRIIITEDYGASFRLACHLFLTSDDDLSYSSRITHRL